MISRRFLMFLIAGGFAATVNFLSRIVLSEWMHYIPAIVLAYLFGMITAFFLNRVLVFRNWNNELKNQVMWFIIVNLAAVVQTIIFSLLLARVIFPSLGIDFHNETMAHAAGVAIPVVTSYLGHKHFSFSSHPKHNIKTP